MCSRLDRAGARPYRELMPDTLVLLSRRHLLTLALTFALAPRQGAAGASAADSPARRIAYEAEVAALYATLRFRVTGVIDERVDRAGGQYAVGHEGEGTGLSSRGETTGLLREGRWLPLRTQSWVKVAGREGRVDVAYDYERRLVQYRSRSETFFRGRLRVVDDTLPLPSGVHVDDSMSALLNLAHGHWRPGPSGALETRIVRRRRDRREGLVEAAGEFRAEIAPISLRLEGDRASGRQTAFVDLTGLSAWAQPGQPAQIVLGADGRPEVITSRLMYGTTFTIRFLPA
jgi:hypothetical protein